MKKFKKLTKTEEKEVRNKISVWEANMTHYLLKGDVDKVNRCRKNISKLELQLKQGKEVKVDDTSVSENK